MRLDTSQQMRTEMRLRMAPRMIQSMEILQLPLMAMQARIAQELIETRVLEIREADPREADPEESPAPEPAPDPAEAFTFPELAEDWADSYAEAHRPS